MDEPVYTTDQIRRFCAVNISTVMGWIDGGKLRAFKTPGGHRRVLRGDLLEFLRTYGMPMPAELRAARRILIVDDEALIIRLVQRVARGLDPAFEFETAANGFEAGRKFAAFAPDLVVLDLMLPGLDGFAVCRAMRGGRGPRGAGPGGARILAISGFDTEENREKILGCGADDYLGKPLSPGPLAGKIARLLGLALGLLLALGGALPRAGAQTPPPANEALEFFAEEARVVTASRREEALREAPVSVEVITAQDIRDSGAVNLWDLLRFRAGLDAYDTGTDGIGVVTIRGFAQSTVKQVQVLVDGRSVISPSRSEVNWEQVPVQLQDIERIEVARGPNAALYGSNAGFGVINILTKKPGAGTLSAAGRGGSGGFFRTEAAGEGAAKDFRFRVSQTHSARDGAALSGGGSAGDFLCSNKQNFRGNWSPAAGTNLDLFAGGSWDTLASTSSRQRRYRGHFELARLTQELGPGELEVAGARSETLTAEERSNGLMRLRELQYDAEALYRLPWLDERLRTLAGASYRLALAQSDQMFAGAPRQQNNVARGFFSSRARLTDLLALSGGVSLERSGTSGTEPAYQAAAVLSPGPEQAFRLSYAFAPTLPSLLDKGANFQESATRLRAGNPGLDSDHLHSYEAGYQGLFLGNLAAGLGLFYLDHRDLNTSVVLGKAGGVTTRAAANGNRALARGLEASLELKLPGRRELYANYTYEDVSDSAGDLAVTESIPDHKLNLGARAALPRGFSVSANLGYKDAYTSGSATSSFIRVPAYWRLDARLAYAPRPGVEVFLAGQNLTEAFHGPEFRGAPAVPRSWQAGLAVGF